MTKSTTILLIIASLLQLNAKNTTISFEKDHCALTESSKTTLKNFAHEFRKSRNKMDLKIVGHTDSDGNYSYNQELSMYRAKAVRDYLISLGIKNRISLYSKGEHQLLSHGKSKEDHELNRRVEIMPQSRSVDNWNAYGIAKLQKKQINTNQDTEIVGEKGTKIRFKKNCFRIPKSDSIVDITFREYTTKEDALLANLSTITPKGKLIESKGMIHIAAKSKGRPVNLKSSKPMELIFPKRTTGDSTQIFYGKRFENGVTWTAGKKEQRCQRTVIDNSTDGNSRIKIYREVCQSGDGLYTVTTSWGNGDIVQQTTRNKDKTGAFPLTSNRLGWINCDKFYNDKSPKIDFVITINKDTKANVYLVFENINSIMPYTFKENNKFHFNNVPKGMAVKVVGIYDAKDKEACHFAWVDTKIDHEFKKRLNFNKIRKENLKL